MRSDCIAFAAHLEKFKVVLPVLPSMNSIVQPANAQPNLPNAGGMIGDMTWENVSDKTRDKKC